VAYSQLTQSLLVSSGIGVGKTLVSHYGIQTSDIAGAAEKLCPSPRLQLGFVGTLAPHMGYDILVRAFKMLPPRLDARSPRRSRPVPFLRQGIA
jgi:glycosyltransferase involved in cell wall biosynthesis